MIDCSNESTVSLELATKATPIVGTHNTYQIQMLHNTHDDE